MTESGCLYRALCEAVVRAQLSPFPPSRWKQFTENPLFGVLFMPLSHPYLPHILHSASCQVLLVLLYYLSYPSFLFHDGHYHPGSRPQLHSLSHQIRLLLDLPQPWFCHFLIPNGKWFSSAW